MPLRRSTLASLALSLLLLASRPALAGETDPEALFAESVKLMEAERYAEAIPKLEEAQRLDPGLGTQFNLAVCYEKTGRLGSAWRNFVEVERLARASGKKQREEAAKSKLAGLKPLVPSLDVRVEETSDVTLKLDGAVVPKAEWAFVPLDPGAHALEASAAAKQSWTKTFDAPAVGQKLSMVVPALASAKGETKVVTVTTETTNGRRTLGFVLGGVGLAGLATATVTGILLLNDKKTADDRCKPRCVDAAGNVDNTGVDAVNRGKTLLPINAVAWGVGIVGVGAGAFFLLTSSKPDADKRAALVPMVGPSGAGASWSGSF